MNLCALAQTTHLSSPSSLPLWMLGAFRRRSISFADGVTDTDTRVFWLQSRNLTIDLRLPKPEEQHAQAPLADTLNLEGWYAQTIWQDEQLSWQNGCSYQLHDRWPEPAQLKRIGNCMVEFAPSGAYVEDWRLLTLQPGPLIGLELVSETDLESGQTRQRKGALIMNGQHVGIVIGRDDPDREQALCSQGETLSHHYHQLTETTEQTWLLDFETHIALRQPDGQFQIEQSLDVARYGTYLDLEGFALASQANFLTQQLIHHGRRIQRLWRVDCLESAFPYQAATPMSSEAARNWRKQEQATLDRYTRMITE
ncbi:hypothetical protein [Celerinatantimonas sp. YJH-8]|uniref:hypothetical protein n=1 Tax=Celerinatantimonas sp. YJH-8 TaxID=3228714 RepID=UPI0038C98730